MGNSFFIRYREQHGLTQKQLGDLLGISQGAVGHIERGFRGVTVANAKKWAEILGVSVAEILCIDEHEDGGSTPDRGSAALEGSGVSRAA